MQVESDKLERISIRGIIFYKITYYPVNFNPLEIIWKIFEGHRYRGFDRLDAALLDELLHYVIARKFPFQSYQLKIYDPWQNTDNKLTKIVFYLLWKISGNNLYSFSPDRLNVFPSSDIINTHRCWPWSLNQATSNPSIIKNPSWYNHVLQKLH